MVIKKMSVLKSKRTESTLQFYETARTLRRRISTDLLQRLCNNNLYKEDYTTDQNTQIATKETYPDFMIDFIRRDILETMRDLMKCISLANEIYPVTIAELDKRRILQDYAIGYTRMLQNELEYCVDIFPKQLHCMLQYADEIDHLIKILRRWKKANNKILERIRAQSTTDFCYCNNNGNANYNNATNTNAVSPDFVEPKNDSKPLKPTMKGDCNPTD